MAEGAVESSVGYKTHITGIIALIQIGLNLMCDLLLDITVRDDFFDLAPAEGEPLPCIAV
jgi:hypothetical protein